MEVRCIDPCMDAMHSKDLLVPFDSDGSSLTFLRSSSVIKLSLFFKGQLCDIILWDKIAYVWEDAFVNVNVIFILSRYINYKKHKLPRLLADWTIGLKCPPKHW